MDTGTGKDAFRDSKQDLDTMRRYEAFLQLQTQADSMTDAEYLAALDSISDGREEFLGGAYSYGNGDEEAEKYRQAVADATEKDDAGQHAGTNFTAMDGMGSTVTDEARDASGDGAVPDAGNDDGIQEEAVEAGADTEEALEAEADGEAEAEAETGSEGLSWDGEMYEGAARYAASLEHGGIESGLEEEAPGPELEGQAAGTAPETEEELQAAAALAIDEPGPEGGPMYTEPSYRVHEDFQVNDVFDQIAAGTGLAGAVMTYEYIPPQEVQAQPETAAKQEPEYGPNMTALKQQLREMDRSAMEKQLDGPSR